MTTLALSAHRVFEPATAPRGFREEVRHGLHCTPKRLPCKFFYDHAGSLLFERICQQPEYYPTRTELAIMERWGDEMANWMGSGCELIEYGSGSSIKTRLLLNRLRQPAGYIPIDISGQHLRGVARALAAEYPRLRIEPICADYTQGFALPKRHLDIDQRVVYFPGSTIGNFEPDEAVAFLARTRQIAGPGSALLIGVDLKKDPRLLHAAYNDSAGVTARFNLNLLARINRELHGSFVPDRFAHYALYNASLGRIEMHLVSLEEQRVWVDGESHSFAQGESIFTESSYKYTLDQFAQLAQDSGYVVRQAWTDERQWFSVQYLTTP